MALLPILVAGGILIGTAVSAIVHADCRRRDVPPGGRRRRAVAFGGLGFAGFLVPHSFADQLRWLYFRVLKPRPVAGASTEWLAVNLAAGLAIAMMVVGLYAVSSRLRTPPTPRSSRAE